MNTDDYLHQCASHLANTEIYQPVHSFPVSAICSQLQSILSDFVPILKPHKNLYSYLTPKPSHTQAPRFYGIPKIHKSFIRLPPIRPIVSHLNSLLSPSARFIDHVLQPVARSYIDYLHNSTALLFKISTCRIISF